MFRLAVCPSIGALKEGPVVGQKVLSREAFLAIMTQHIVHVLPSTQFDEEGFGVIQLPVDVLPLVSSGVGCRSEDPDDYVIRKHQGRVGLYLKRRLALPVERCTAHMFTKTDYLVNWLERGEEAPLSQEDLEGVTHVVSGFKFWAGPRTVLRLDSYVNSLAKQLGKSDPQVAARLLGEAWEVNNYWKTFAEVSD